MPSDPISPDFREAPRLLPSPNGKVNRYQQYVNLGHMV